VPHRDGACRVPPRRYRRRLVGARLRRRASWTLTYVDLASASTRSVELTTDEYFPTDKHGRVLRWTGDGSSLSVVQYTEGPTVLDLHRRLLFDGTLGPAIGPLGATSFDWTIDGRAAFDAGSNLFVLSPDGSRRRLTWRGGTDPSWSPRRALDRVRSGRPDLGRPEPRWTSQAAHEERR
jgi:hypothetical protein